MATINFSQVGGAWVGEFTSSGEDSVHLNREKQGSVEIYARPSNSDDWAGLGTIPANECTNNVEFNVKRPSGWKVKVVSATAVTSASYESL